MTGDIEILDGQITKFPKAALVKIRETKGSRHRQAELRENAGSLELWMMTNGSFQRGSAEDEAWLKDFLGDVTKPIPPIPPIPPEAPELPVVPVPPAVATPAETGPRATIRNMIRRGPFGVITGNNSVSTSNRNDWKILPGLPLITLLALIVAALVPKNIAPGVG